MDLEKRSIYLLLVVEFIYKNRRLVDFLRKICRNVRGSEREGRRNDKIEKVGGGEGVKNNYGREKSEGTTAGHKEERGDVGDGG